MISIKTLTDLSHMRSAGTMLVRPQCVPVLYVTLMTSTSRQEDPLLVCSLFAPSEQRPCYMHVCMKTSSCCLITIAMLSRVHQSTFVADGPGHSNAAAVCECKTQMAELQSCRCR